MVEYTGAQVRGETNVELPGSEVLVDPREQRETDQLDLTGSRALEGVYFEPSVRTGSAVDHDATKVYDGSWAIPGKGAAGSRCGVVAPNGFCDGEHHVTFGRHDCGRRSCPRCWYSGWRNPRTVEAVVRLAAARYDADDGIDRRAVHGVVSPPEPAEIETTDEFYSARSKAVEVAKEAGIRGGFVVPHGYRIIDRIQTRIQAERDAGEFEGGDWKWVREHDAPWYSFVEWSPHFHVIGLSTDVQGGDRSDGWVVHNIKRKRADGEVRHSLAPFTLTGRDGYEDMASVTGYVLSHATFEKESNRQTVTWFGDLHGSNFAPEKELSEGAYSKIRRTTQEVVGAHGDDEEDGEGVEEGRECPYDGCTGTWHHINEAGDYLDQRGSGLSDDAYNRVHTAFLWWQGEIKPPPGAKNPTTEEDAREAWEWLL